MSEKNFKANCGCEIHIIKWNYKAEVASVKNCPLHKAAEDLLTACRAAYDALDNVYDVDEPTPGHRKEHPFSGAGDILNKLTEAIHKAEGKAA